MKRTHNSTHNSTRKTLSVSNCRRRSSTHAAQPERRILGIDPGSRVLGYALISKTSRVSNVSKMSNAPDLKSASEQSQFERLTSGSLNLMALAKKEIENRESSSNMSMAQRLGCIWTSLSAIIEEYKPTELAIEDLFSHKNAQSMKKLGQARGVVLALAGVLNLPITEYSPASIKQAVAGHGRAKKEQVRDMLKSFMDLPESMGTDESDAIAIALCHIRMSSVQLRSNALRSNTSRSHKLVSNTAGRLYKAGI